MKTRNSASALEHRSASELKRFLRGTIQPPRRRLPALSLFSNAGVGDYGYRLAGFTFHVHAELNTKRLDLCKNNHPSSARVEGDLRETWQDVVEEYRHRCDKDPVLLAAMPPCQGMSSGSNSKRLNETNDDPRNTLSFVIADVAEELNPEFVVVENVPGILFTRVVDPATGEKEFVGRLLADKMAKYDPYACTLQFADYAVPQRRLRTIITFVRKDTNAAQTLKESLKYPYPRPTHSRYDTSGLKPWTTARKFLEEQNLTPLSAAPNGRRTDPHDPLHFVPRLDPRRFKWVASIPPHEGGGAFENGCLECGETEIPLHRIRCPACGGVLVSRPHVVEGKRIRKVKGHVSSYRRMPSDMPATTITTATGHLGSDANIHPWENRLLSPRECALLQTVPRTFDWSTPDGTHPPATHLRAMIGEALPPWYAYLHGLALRVAAGSVGHKNLLDEDAAECQSLYHVDLRAIQEHRRRKLEKSRRPRRRTEAVESQQH